LDFTNDKWTWQLGFDPEELEKRKLEKNSFKLPQTGLRFVDDHFGPRPGCIHALMGSTGRGKSTLLQSLILEWGKRCNILLYLTEESVDRIESKLFEKEAGASYLTTRLHIAHERDVLKKVSAFSHRDFLLQIEDRIKETEAKILIIDNLTTSEFYEGKFQSIMAIISGLRDLAEKYSLPVFVICHTKKGVNETTKGLMLPDDVRGSAMLANMADYFYTFYRVRSTSEFGQVREGAFIYVNKSRDHDNQDSFYRLEYNINSKRYIKDELVNFNTFKDFMRERDKM
jgi:hypothetical protein